MKAWYRTFDGVQNEINYGVIKTQTMEHGDGFTLIGFEDYEAVDREDIACAITNVSEFHIVRPKNKVGFGEDKD